MTIRFNTNLYQQVFSQSKTCVVIEVFLTLCQSKLNQQDIKEFNLCFGASNNVISYFA